MPALAEVVDDVHDIDGLLRGVRAGSQSAFAQLYDVVAPVVYGLVTRIVGNRTAADQVTQEIFVQVWQCAPQSDPTQGSGLTWILTIAHYRSIQHARALATAHNPQIIRGDVGSTLRRIDEDAA